MMKKIAVYPYSMEFNSVLKNLNFLDAEYEIRSLISPKGLQNNKQTIDFGGGKSIRLYSDLSEGLDESNTLLIPDFKTSHANVLPLEQKIIESIIPILKDLEYLLCCTRLEDNYLALLKEACEENDCKFIYWAEIKKAQEFGFGKEVIAYLKINQELEEINTPIVAIAGMYYNTNKFDVSLTIGRMFLEKGYKVAQIGSSNYSELFGVHQFPSFMFDPDMDGTMKILLFNRYVKRIEQEESPDIIILGIPGAVQNLSGKYTMGFAMTPYMALSAVLVDYFIVCSYFEFLDELFEKISLMCEYKFGCPVDCYHISNLAIDMAATSERKRIVANYFGPDFVKENFMKMRDAETPRLNLLEVESQKKLFGLILDKIACDFGVMRRNDL